MSGLLVGFAGDELHRPIDRNLINARLRVEHSVAIQFIGARKVDFYKRLLPYVLRELRVYRLYLQIHQLKHDEDEHHDNRGDAEHDSHQQSGVHLLGFETRGHGRSRRRHRSGAARPV